MSTSDIACRSCGHVLAKKHHSGRITSEPGIRSVYRPDGHVEYVCPCGVKRTVVQQVKKAA